MEYRRKTRSAVGTSNGATPQPRGSLEQLRSEGRRSRKAQGPQREPLTPSSVGPRSSHEHNMYLTPTALSIRSRTFVCEVTGLIADQIEAVHQDNLGNQSKGGGDAPQVPRSAVAWPHAPQGRWPQEQSKENDDCSVHCASTDVTFTESMMFLPLHVCGTRGNVGQQQHLHPCTL